MGDNVIAQPMPNNDPDLEEIEAQILGLAPMDTLSLQYEIARNALIRAYTDLNLIENYYEAQVETGRLPIVPEYLARRVKPALRAGNEGMDLLTNTHATITSAPGIAKFMHDARFVLLTFIRKHDPSLPSDLARFEPRFRHKKRLFTTPTRTRHGHPRQYTRH